MQQYDLIISSDDAGMCQGVNAATFDTLERGIVTSVSVMSPCPAFKEFATYAAAHPKYDYGVHLTLTCDVPAQPWGPVSPVDKVPSLVDDAGNLWPTNGLVAQHADIREAEMELRAQIDRAISSGIRVSHLDHHMFVLYSRLDLFELYVNLALDYQLPIRILRRPDSPSSYSFPTQDPKWTQAYERSLARLSEAGLPILDAMESNNYGEDPQNKRGYHLNTIRELRPGVTEMIIHCAYSRPPHADPPDVARREADTAFVLSKEAREQLQRMRVSLISWDQLRSRTLDADLKSNIETDGDVGAVSE